MTEAQRHGAGPIAGSDDRLERLQRAGVALLEPLLIPAADAMRADVLARRLQSCAEVADALGLRSLNYLSALAGPHLRQRPRGDPAPSERESIEAWIGDVVAFCAGQVAPADAAGLLTRLSALPGFAAVPGQFSSLIGDRLRADAVRVAQWAAQPAATSQQPLPTLQEPVPTLHGPMPTPHEPEPTLHEPEPTLHERQPLPNEPPAHASAAVPLARWYSDAEALRGAPSDDASPAGELPGAGEPSLQPAGRLQVARDELELLAEAVEMLELDVHAPLRALSIAATDRTAIEEVLDIVSDHLERLSSACEFVGMAPLARAFAPALRALEAWRSGEAVLDQSGREALLALPGVLTAYLREPNGATAAALTAVACSDAWRPGPDADPAGLAATLSDVDVLASRQVAAPAGPASDSDLSLAIPQGADREVVDHLLNELPTLAAAFAEAVRRDPPIPAESLAEAQRVAHTLKGSANTVGVRGIATVTHVLEDLLLLAGREPAAVSRDLHDFLGEAADCLEEMCEAVAGLGEGPADAAALHRRAVQWIESLIAGDDTGRDDQGRDDQGRDDQGRDDQGTHRPAGDSGKADPLPGDQAQGGHGRADQVQGDYLPAAGGEDRLLRESALQGAPLQGGDRELDDAGGGDAATRREWLRVPATLVDGMLELAGQTAIMIAQVHEQLSQLEQTRRAVGSGSDRMRDLSRELERLVDIRGLALTGRSRNADFDALELDEYNDLHTVARRIAESSADEELVDEQFARQLSSLHDLLAKLERNQTALHDTMLRTRMVDADSIAARLERSVRQAGRLSGKQARLVLQGGRTQLDAQLLQALVDPLTHLLRNAVDHGIEPPHARVRGGKPEQGVIRVAFARQGANLIVEIADDGAGLDEAAVLRRGRALGWLADDDRPSPDTAAKLILRAGFSTRDDATQLSGRGIGLDVVNQTVRRLRGTLSITSHPGAGMTVRVQCPLRMALIPVMVMRTPTHVVALSVRQVETLVPCEGVAIHEDGCPVFDMEGEPVPVERMEAVLGLPGDALASNRRAELLMIVRRNDGRRVALRVPELEQARQVLVRPLPPFLEPVGGLEGAAVLGDGLAAPVFDLPERLDARDAAPASAPALELARPPSPPVCLVVDDSVSVRRATEAFMRDLGFEVHGASDGIEALGVLQERTPDLVVLDLEMPRMDGLDLTKAIRADARTRAVPVIMVTSRFSERHRQFASAAGVDVYLTKPFTDDELATEVQRCMLRRLE